MNIEMQYKLVQVMTDLAVRPWFVAKFRENPTEVLQAVPGLSAREMEDLANGHKGAIYRLACLPFWAEVPARMPRVSADPSLGPDHPLSLHESDHAHDVDHMHFWEQEASRPSDDTIRDTERKLDEAVTWFASLTRGPRSGGSA
jgi:hypothetical protein